MKNDEHGRIKSFLLYPLRLRKDGLTVRQDMTEMDVSDEMADGEE
jgi:hypothetical protein